MRKRFHRHQKPPADLDITTFMNLMVILVPFLLITAVFNQVNILEMNLPPAKNEAAPPPETQPPLQLELILLKDELVVNEKPGSRLKSFPLANGQYDLKGVSDLLKKVKASFPAETAVTLLLEPEVPYDNLIQVMDTVRMFEVKENGKVVQTELFPDIALGDAPGNDERKRQP